MKANIKKYYKYTLISLFIMFWAYLDYNNYFNLIGDVLIYSDPDSEFVKSKVDYPLHYKMHKNYSLLNHQNDIYNLYGLIYLSEHNSDSSQKKPLDKPQSYILFAKNYDFKIDPRFTQIENSSTKYSRKDYIGESEIGFFDNDIEYSTLETISIFKIGEYDYSISLSWFIHGEDKDEFLKDPIKKIDEVLNKAIVEWRDD
ncbi:MAG: hypothetical protein GXZ08_05075 [Tissierellia bacterium]|nr:hypothetical protein [Tissierellia bacterium]